VSFSYVIFKIVPINAGSHVYWPKTAAVMCLQHVITGDLQQCSLSSQQLRLHFTYDFIFVSKRKLANIRYIFWDFSLWKVWNNFWNFQGH